MKLILTCLCMTFLTGCATTSYTPPKTSTVPASKYTVLVDQPYDETWARLINHAASTFFAIDEFEKDSGLMTLSFGSSDPGRFIDCGNWTSNTFIGNYASFMAQQYGASLTGKMNIIVRPIDDNKSEVRVNARYIFTANRNTWAFDTGGSDYQDVGMRGLYAAGTSFRDCMPTYKAENSILEAMNE